MKLSSLVCALIAALAVVLLALYAHWCDRATDTLVLGCDTFGYERMGRVVRDSRASGTRPDYFLHDAQTRWLIAQCKAHNLPVPVWGESVTTHAHHYFPGTDQVGPQYPPGTGRVLALFPAGDDVKTLDRWSIVGVALAGLGLVGWCAWRGLVASSLAVAGTVAATLAPYSWLQAASYSINATLAPLFAGTLLAWAATRVHGRRAAVTLALLAGAAFGLLLQVRLASTLLAPAAALLFVPRRWRLLLPYGLGVLLAGVLPVLLHDRTITGSFFGSTYNGGDRAESLSQVAGNFHFYFGVYEYETGWLHVLGLLGLLLVWSVLVATTWPRGARPAWGGWLADHYGSVLAPVCAAGLSLAYFLAHEVTISYYLTPAVTLTSLLLGLLFISLEEHWRRVADLFVRADAVRTGFAWTTAVLAVLAVAFNYRALGDLVRAGLEVPQDPPHFLLVPPALLEPDAWIWGDLYTSSILFYTGHPAFKITFATPATRQLLYGWVHAKGDPQYLVEDSPLMKPIVAEARERGWQLTPVGAIRGATCYRLDAPPGLP